MLKSLKLGTESTESDSIDTREYKYLNDPDKELPPDYNIFKHYGGNNKSKYGRGDEIIIDKFIIQDKHIPELNDLNSTQYYSILSRSNINNLHKKIHKKKITIDSNEENIDLITIDPGFYLFKGNSELSYKKINLKEVIHSYDICLINNYNPVKWSIFISSNFSIN